MSLIKSNIYTALSFQFRKDESTPPQGFGSFHYQYFLDGVLIAVGVIDILPECVSSVYFFYDPDYSFLSLGTYASLREIALVRELSKSCQQLTNYYLGFYIPSCPKMRYKANVKPSYLLCPEVYTWHLLDDKLNQEIDSVLYKRINTTGDDEDKVTDDDLRNVLVLANRTAMKYGDFRRVSRNLRLKNFYYLINSINSSLHFHTSCEKMPEKSKNTPRLSDEACLKR